MIGGHPFDDAEELVVPHLLGLSEGLTLFLERGPRFAGLSSGIHEVRADSSQLRFQLLDPRCGRRRRGGNRRRHRFPELRRVIEG